MKTLVKTFKYVFFCLFFISLVACMSNQITAPETDSSIEPISFATEAVINSSNLNMNSEETQQIPAPTATFAVSKQPEAAIPSSTKTEMTPTDTPEAIITVPLPDLTIAYVQNASSGNSEHSEIWLFNTSNQENRLIHSTEQGSNIAAGDLRWNPANNDELYYVQVDPDRSWRLWRYDLLLEVAEPVTGSFPPGFGLIRDWSADGNWLSFYTEDFSNDEKLINMVLVNVNTGDFFVQEFTDIVWSPNQPSHYAFYAPDGKNVVVRDANEPDSLTRIPVNFSKQIMNNIDVGFTPVVRFAWQPSGKSPLFVEANGELYSFDFDVDQWEKIRNFEINTRDLFWSPSGEWLIINPYDSLYALRKDQLEDSLIPLVMDRDLVVVEGWIEGSDSPIISTDNKLWIFDLEMPNKLVELFDLTSIGLESGTNIDILVIP
jgi:hypothetical protein